MERWHFRAVGLAVPLCLASGLAVPVLGQPCGEGWVLRSSVGPAASPHTMAFDQARGRMVLFGGHLPASPFYSGETWEWDGQAWLLRATTGPSPRDYHAMAYDGSRVVLFGGKADGPSTGDTWEWDGAAGAWHQLTPPVSPSARSSHAMVYDPIRGTVVLVGGFSASPVMETWEWSRAAGTWSLQSASGLPSPQSIVAGAFDASRSAVTVSLYGWSSGALLYTRASAGNADWTPMSFGFGPRATVGMAFDTSRAQLVLVGNNDGYNGPPSAQTWEMGPGAPAWALRSSATPGGSNAALAFDSARSRTVLFSNHATWEWDGLSSGPAITAAPTYVIAQPDGSSPIPVTATGAGLSYQWQRGNQVLSNTGPYSGVQTPTLTVGPATLDLVGLYTLTVSNACGPVTSQHILLNLACGINCDGSYNAPVLTANDFQCYLNAFASGDSYANCDKSTGTPMLTANDFQCFMNKYAARDCHW